LIQGGFNRNCSSDSYRFLYRLSFTMAMHWALLFVCSLGWLGWTAADLRVAAYFYPGYFNHWPNASGMKQFKYLGKRGICANKKSFKGQCLGNDSRCRVWSEKKCKEAAQQVPHGCTWKGEEAAHQRTFTRTNEECQARCGMDPDCKGWSRRGYCKLYTQELKLNEYRYGGYCYEAAGKGTMKQLHAKYMIPSTFGYQGLVNQKQRNYDQFLRSNIDNEHDNRNFLTEDGEDALPFRSMGSEVYDSEKSGEEFGNQTYDLKATMKPGESMLVPLRWNNPHSAELEVNIWIFQGDKPVVVPVKKPTCSGEGYQDNIFKFTIPSDFDKLGSKIPGFKGCNADTKPPCTLQVYSHSVESRTYALGFPIIVTGHDGSRTTSSNEQIEPMTTDPGLDITNLRDVCRPSFDPESDIKKAVPRWARLVSDVYNHAYQNSDFSPYSGQQHESISKNLQASAINKMVTGNRGELGRYLLTFETSKRLRALRTMENRLYRNYESMANKIIEKHGKEMLDGQGITIGAEGTTQVLGKCFRCGEVGSLLRRRLTTNTYIPSFQLKTGLIWKAKSMTPEKYKSLITEGGLVQIYAATYADLAPFFYVSMPYGILYQPAVPKATLTTKADESKFRKKGLIPSARRRQYDRGQYAARMALMEKATEIGCDLKSCSPQWKKAEGWCAGGLAMPLMFDRNATCVTGDCAACSNFFNYTDVIGIPVITPLAAAIASTGEAPNSLSTIPAYPDLDGSPRIGRPGSNITGDTDQWKLVKPQHPGHPPGTKPPPVDSPAARRRRRRGKGNSAGPARRRRRRGSSTGPSRRRRRRSSKSRRRRRSSKKSAAGLAELAKEVAMLQMAQ